MTIESRAKNMMNLYHGLILMEMTKWDAWQFLAKAVEAEILEARLDEHSEWGHDCIEPCERIEGLRRQKEGKK